MNYQEVTEFFDAVNEFYPRFHSNAKVIEYWAKKFEKIPAQLIHKTFDRWVETHPEAPSFATFKQYLSGYLPPPITGATANRQETKTHFRDFSMQPWIPKSKLDIAMDALGAKYVTEAISEIVGARSEYESEKRAPFKWTDLVNRKRKEVQPDGSVKEVTWNWIPAYRAKVDELYQMAIQYNNAPRTQDGSDPVVAPETRFADAF